MRPEVLPEKAVLLHIGPYKTGSTAIQASLAASRGRLAEFGVAYPGGWRRLMAPAYAVMEWSTRGHPVPPISAWETYAATVQGLADRRVCISTEDFGRLRAIDKINRIADDLGRDRLHVLAVARPFHRQLPSAWQERVKSHGTIRYQDWLEGVLGDDRRDESHRRFWRSNDLAAVLRAWQHAVPANRFHLVIADETDRSHLLRVFEALLGLPDHFLQLQPAANASLDPTVIELLRQFNQRFQAHTWPPDLYRRLIQDGMNRGFQTAGPDPEAAAIPALPAWAIERVRELTKTRIATIQDAGIVVHGDPATLQPPPDYQTANDTDFDSPTAVRITTMVNGLVALLQAVQTRNTDLAATTATAGTKPLTTPPPQPAPLAHVKGSELIAELIRRGKRRARHIVRPRP